MAAERYLLERAFGPPEEIDAAEAQRLYGEAKADPDADVSGDLETGLYFFRTDNGLQLVRWHVTPLPD